MADPFSLVTNIVSLLDVSVRLYNYLKKVKAGAAAIEQDINALLHEIELLQTITRSIYDTFQADLTLAFTPSSKDENVIKNLWQQTAHILRDCQAPVVALEDIVQHVFGKGGLGVSSKPDSIFRFLRKDSRQLEFVKAREKLNSSHRLLEINLTAINM